MGKVKPASKGQGEKEIGLYLIILLNRIHITAAKTHTLFPAKIRKNHVREAMVHSSVVSNIGFPWLPAQAR